MITVLSRGMPRSSEGDNSEIECKDGFQKHYNAQDSSEWSRCVEE